MRRFLGLFVLAVGFGGLGVVATTNHAKRLEASLQDRAARISEAANLSVEVRVSGRDVVVSGLAYDQALLDQLASSLSSMRGVRVVDVDGVSLLPVADPFEIQIAENADGVMTASGVVPTMAAREQLGALAADLPLAMGAPDGWIEAVHVGLLALGAANFGDVVVSGRHVTLSGEVNTPIELAALTTALVDLPDGFTSDVEVDVLDDGTPLRLTLVVREGVVTGRAKLLADLADDDVFAHLDAVVSPLEASDPDWPDIARIVGGAAAGLIEGEVTLEGMNLSFQGQASPEGKVASEAALSRLPDTLIQDISIEVWDDGVPLQVVMEWDGDAASATGKLPAEFVLGGPAGVAVAWAGATGFRTDVDGTFSTNADAAVTALGTLLEGRLTVSADLIALSGIAVSPRVNVALDNALAVISTEVEIHRDITYLDDGSPASWGLSYDAGVGAAIEGRLPTTLSQGDLQIALGAGELTGTVGVAVDDDVAGAAIDVLNVTAAYLPEVERLELTHDEGGTQLELVLSPGVDIDLIATELAQNVPVDVAFTLSSIEVLPEQGTFRVNAATGVGEVFRNGFWIPDLDFVTSAEGCLEQTLMQMEKHPIQFLPGSARLSATSVRVINALAAVAVPCVEADLELEVAGHTDATGDADENQFLSQTRALVVREALIARGVPQRAITSIGFGARQPISDNETPEGRAENRRTEIEWFERGALRNP